MRDAPFDRSSVRMPIELILLLFSLLLISPTVSGVQFVSPTFDYPPLGELNTPGVYQHVFALFGPDPDTYNTTAPLWYDPLAPTFCHPSSDATIKGKIVLARRDSACDFATRARNAADMGAVGLIIGDNKYSQQFDVHWMGPPQIDPPMVNIPVILILGETYQLLLGTLQTKTIDPPPYRDTIATIDQRGLFMTMDQYWESVDGLAYWDDRLRIAFNLSPFLIVALCYWAFYKTWRPLTPASPAAPAPPAGQGQQQQSAPPVGAQPSQPPSRAVSAPPPRSSVTSPSSSTFSDTEVNQLNLPIPPSLSSNADGMSDVSLDVAHGGRIHDSSSLTDEHEHKENEGLMSSGIGSSSATGSHRADLASQPASLRAENQGQMLNRPLLAAPTVAPQMRLYYHLLKALSAAGKPYFILRCNALVYAIHAICGLAVLIAGWNEKCSNETYLAMVSLWCARAMIGFRICFWQCHSNTAVPTCADIFFKNWSDCVILLTGSMFSWNDAQKTDCEMRAPTIYRAIQIWTIITYITYGLRIVFYAMDRYSQRHGGSLPHIFTISARSFLTLLNGGFSCAGALDKNQPATQLDLMLIPTVTYRTGMYAADDALCAVCMCEYTPGETLRLLNCSHHFHSTCVDTWLLQKNSCPVCRQTIDQERVVRRGGASEDEIQDVQLDEEAQIPRPQPPYDGDRPPSPSRIGQYDERV